MERDRVEEQSHKDEMRAALRGDFERMRQRQAGESDAAAPTAQATLTLPEPTLVTDAAAGSWLDRLLGRS